MTQRIFDVYNKKDMADIWDILPDWAEKIKKSNQTYNYDVILSGNENYAKEACIFKINWHDKTEITRPIQEATEADLGKLCKFWDYQGNPTTDLVGILKKMKKTTDGRNCYKMLGSNLWHTHAIRLTANEVKELC